MSEFKFKPEQQEIIDQIGNNLLVSASAGSGKTTVMIAKIVSMILQQKTSTDKILVLTYTKSAASEMKQKLIRALKDEIDKGEFLQDEIDKVESADISTIHSFCQRLIKRNFYAIKGLDMGFELLDDHEKTVLRERAMKQTLSDYQQSFNENYMLLLDYYGRDRSDRQIAELVYLLNNYLEATLDKEKFRDETALYLYDNVNIAYEILNTRLLGAVNSFVYNFQALENRARDLGVEKYLENTGEILGALLQISKENSYQKNMWLLQSFKFKNVVKQEGFLELGEELAAEKSSLSTWVRVEKNKGYFEEELNNYALNETSMILKQLLTLEKNFEKNYTQVKRQRNAVDYSDLERLAIYITSQPEFKKEIRQKYDYIFVDEFQDANPIQEKLLENISHGDNLFMVGDVKQSIYGFRRSSPEIFLRKQTDFKDENLGLNKFLNLNFRSDKSILEFVNMVFDKIMTPVTSNIDYKQNSRFVAFKQLEKPEYSRVKVTAITPSQKEKKEQPKKVFDFFDLHEQDEEVSKAEKEAFLVAEDILKLKNSFLFKNGERQDINFKDMTIIVRKRGVFFDAFCNKLVELGVPIYANSAKGIFEEPDSKKILALLNLVQNFNDDYSLATVMNSFFGGFSLQELTDVKLKTQDEKHFYKSVLAYASNQKDELSNKINNFLKFISEFCLSVQTSGIYLSLERAFEKTGYKEKVLCLPQGEQRLVSLEKILQIFLNESLNFNVSAFLEFASLAGKEIKAPDFFAGDEDCVTVTTIHSSKGLEYPIVFFVEAGSDFTRKPTSSEIQISDKLGVGLKFYNPTEGKKQNSIALEAIKIENKKEEFAELLRLLYVGLTRSVEYLYIYGSIDTAGLKEFKSDYDVFEAKSYIELILRSINQDNLNKVSSERQVRVNYDEAEFVVESINEAEIEPEELAQPPIIFSKGDEEFERQLEAQLNKEYAQKEVKTLPVKNSVSSLLREVQYASINTSPQKLTLNEHMQVQNQLAELGTLYHKVFEMIDFNKEITLSLVNDIIENKIVSELKQHLNPQKIYSSALLVKQTLKGQNYEKEKKFMMYVPYSSVTDSNIDQKVLVQGVIDLYSLGKTNILIDFKLTNAPNEEIILKRYTKQIQLYKQAIELAFKVKNINCFILDINKSKLIKVEV